MQPASKVVNDVFQEVGLVRARAGASVMVETGSGIFEAKRATSCLVVPESGDTVLVAVPKHGALYVLAVLERGDEDGPTRLGTEGDLRIESAGRVTVRGVEGASIQSPGPVEVAARSFEVSAVDASVSVDKLRVMGRWIEAHADTVKGVLGTVDTFLDRLSQHVKRSYRFIEEIDVTRAEQVDCRARQTMTMRARNTFLSAEELVKLDGEQVHLG